MKFKTAKKNAIMQTVAFQFYDAVSKRTIETETVRPSYYEKNLIYFHNF